MNDLKFIVLTGMSAPNKLWPVYKEQLESAGIPYHVEPLTISSSSDGRLGWCIMYWRAWAERFSSYDRLILTDAWDVLCYGSREEIAARLVEFPSYPIFAAEKNCYPEPSLGAKITTPAPWKYANGGMLTASPADLINWCNLVETHPKYDPFMIGQQWLNRRLAEDDPLVKLDCLTHLFYCMFIASGEMGVIDGKPYNTIHKTFPLLIHFNGSWPWDSFLEMMKLSKETISK